MRTKQQRPAISIIVPIYNVENYIKRCLVSIQEQTFKDWECILVDDGSPDKSGKICDEFAITDSRFNVIHQQNGGVSKARQTGTNAAQGEYTIHVDPDDWIESNMLNSLYLKAKEEDADMVICDFIMEENGINQYMQQKPYSTDPTQIARQMLCYIDGYNILHGSCWNKLIKRASYNNDKIKIDFQPTDITICEDLLFNLRLCYHIKKITYLNKAFYHYIIRDKASLSATNSMHNINMKLKVANILKTELNIPDSDLYIYKRITIFNTLMGKHFNNLPQIFPEIHQQLIKDGTKYNLLVPIPGCLAIALKGYPRLAYYIYQLNINMIYFLKRIKHLIVKHS